MQLGTRTNALDIATELRVLMIDDHLLVAEGLRAALAQSELFFKMEIALDCAAATNILTKDQDFDLILLDLSLPDSRGLRFLRKLMQQQLLIPIVILSGSEDPEDVELALTSGAQGFICKSSSRQEIYDAIVAILQGKTVTPAFYRHHRRHHRQDPQVDLAAITPRQAEVLNLLAQGLPNKRICSELNLTEDTIKSHLKSLFMHLNVHNRTECVRVAAKWNLID